MGLEDTPHEDRGASPPDTRFDQVAGQPGPQDVLDEMLHVVQPAYADHGVCLKGPVLSGETPFERDPGTAAERRGRHAADAERPSKRGRSQEAGRATRDTQADTAADEDPVDDA